MKCPTVPPVQELFFLLPFPIFCCSVKPDYYASSHPFQHSLTLQKCSRCKPLTVPSFAQGASTVIYWIQPWDFSLGRLSSKFFFFIKQHTCPSLLKWINLSTSTFCFFKIKSVLHLQVDSVSRMLRNSKYFQDYVKLSSTFLINQFTSNSVF